MSTVNAIETPLPKCSSRSPSVGKMEANRDSRSDRENRAVIERPIARVSPHDVQRHFCSRTFLEADIIVSNLSNTRRQWCDAAGTRPRKQAVALGDGASEATLDGTVFVCFRRTMTHSLYERRRSRNGFSTHSRGFRPDLATRNRRRLHDPQTRFSRSMILGPVNREGHPV